MCNVRVIEFFIQNINCGEFQGKSVIEVGSQYINGSVRPFIEKFARPEFYVGVDISPGKFVDEIVPGEKLVDKFGKDRFDIVVSTEMLEHVKNWRSVVNNLKEILKPDGFIYNYKIKRIRISRVSIRLLEIRNRRYTENFFRF